MADYYRLILSITGPKPVVDAMLAAELSHDQRRPYNDAVRLTIDVLEVFDDDDTTAYLEGEQAWDEGEMWAQELADRWPDLAITGMVQVWNDLVFTARANALVTEDLPDD